eukprot:TRINITY_DN71269_c0_g1_i1.p1 TRINITY_DN71269_c0_g1~~TRINITY_DN71269_c0_g1_i1.p1  ORF type:complete len:326 (+),score=75.99 TRINITY_DN71269_c0_g1_i1:123-1100(+)
MALTHVTTTPRVDVGFRDRWSHFEPSRGGGRPSSSSSASAPLTDALSGTAAGPAAGAHDGLDALPPAYVQLFDSVRESKREIKVRIQQLVTMHKAFLQNVFAKDSKGEEQAIDIRTAEIQKLFEACKNQIRDAEDRIQRADPTVSISETERRVVHNVKVAVVTELNDLSRTFRDEQRKYLSQRMQQKQKAQAAAFGADEWETHLAAQARRDAYMEKGFTDEQMAQLEMNEESITQRDKEIFSIYQSIVQLHEMFRDLADLIIDQGSLLDRIDYNIENTHTAVVEANRQLEGARKYQEKSKFTLIIMILVALVGVAALALIIKLSV